MLAPEHLAAVASLWGRTGRELTVRFSGTSMEPTLASGAEVLLRCGEPLAAGDIIAYLAAGQVILHRVVARAKTGDWILTRGDARTLPDAPILRREAVFGRVAGVRRDDAFVDPPSPPPDSLPRRLVVEVCRAALEASPRAGASLLSLLVGARRALLSAAGRLRRRPGSPDPR